MKDWTEAVWQAVLRQGGTTRAVTRQQLISNELPRIRAETGSRGKTPQQTMSRELQGLRKTGAIIFDGNGNYRIASGLAKLDVPTAIATEAQRLQWARIGQSGFRTALDARWQSACPLTGITARALLRASHIVPWNRCESDAERLEPDNGLLLSALWDAAFDRGLASFDDDGTAMLAARLDRAADVALRGSPSLSIATLTDGNVRRLARHRAMHAGQGLRRAT